MNKRSMHVPKSRSEKDAYNRYIARTDTQPTVDDGMDFESSVKSGEELTGQKSPRKREVPFQDRIFDYVKQRWLEWMFVIATLVAGYLLYDSKVNIAIIEYKVSYQQNQIDKLNLDIDKLSTNIENNNINDQDRFDKLNAALNNINLANASQNASISELKLKLDFLEKRLGP